MVRRLLCLMEFSKIIFIIDIFECIRIKGIFKNGILNFFWVNLKENLM